MADRPCPNCSVRFTGPFPFTSCPLCGWSINPDKPSHWFELEPGLYGEILWTYVGERDPWVCDGCGEPKRERPTRVIGEGLVTVGTYCEACKTRVLLERRQQREAA